MSSFSNSVGGGISIESRHWPFFIHQHQVPSYAKAHWGAAHALCYTVSMGLWR
jgi:hypothetical protein